MEEIVRIDMNDLKNMRYKNDTWRRVLGDRIPVEVVDVDSSGITVKVIDEKDIPRESKPDYILTGKAVIEELGLNLPYFYSATVGDRDDIPEWADGLVIRVNGLAMPVRRSRYNENQYYTKENWRAHKISKETYLAVIRRYMEKKMFYGGYFILTKDGRLFDAVLVRQTDTYEVYEIR